MGKIKKPNKVIKTHVTPSIPVNKVNFNYGLIYNSLFHKDYPIQNKYEFKLSGNYFKNCNFLL
jgi:hypothetical protein